MKVAIAGGGTAGHVFPAIALAGELVREDGTDVVFLGTPEGLEARLVPEAGFAFIPIAAAPLERSLSLRTLTAPITALRSVRACGPSLRGADVVVGMGGYVSVAPVLAARGAGAAVLLHEQNAIPGLANRLLARRANTVAVSFADAASRLPQGVHTVVTGNPVRDRILRVPVGREALRAEALGVLDLEVGRSSVLVFGGSLGALRLNRTVAAAAGALRDRGDLQLLILTGPQHLASVTAQVAGSAPLIVRTLPFLDRMELAYAVADLVVARAGATSVAEIAVCGLASVLVPYPHATADHQTANARELVRAGAAELVIDADLEPGDLAGRIAALVDDDARRRAMSAAASRWARPDAAALLATEVRKVAG